MLLYLWPGEKDLPVFLSTTRYKSADGFCLLPPLLYWPQHRVQGLLKPQTPRVCRPFQRVCGYKPDKGQIRLGEARKWWANDGCPELNSSSKWTLNQSSNYCCGVRLGWQYKGEAGESTEPLIYGFCPLHNVPQCLNIGPLNYIENFNFIISLEGHIEFLSFAKQYQNVAVYK